MSLEVVLQPKTKSTCLTHERFFPRVDDAVLQQPHFTLEGLFTLGAFERAFLRVRPLVNTQVAGSGEPLPTGGTRVWPCSGVDGLVFAQTLLPGEVLPTDVTHEGLHLSVRHLVVSERTLRGECSAAHVALQRVLLQLVKHLVDSEVSQQTELLVALVAAQELFWIALLSFFHFVGQQVSLQSLLLVETFLTAVTGERFDVTRQVFLQLVVLMETFVTELTEESLFFVHISPLLSLLLLRVFITES